MTIHVFGSLNMDLVCRAPRLPTPGETLLGDSFDTVAGGKGANQAVAAVRLGVSTTLAGRVGKDAFGRTLQQQLQQEGIDGSGVIPTTTPTGVATIVVDQAGRNQIVVVPGANGEVDPQDINRLAPQICPGDMLLLQLEIPLAAVAAAARTATQAGATVMLDPAPAMVLSPALLAQVAILTPNQGEAQQLTGQPVTDVASALTAARMLQRQGPASVVVKLGAEGAVVVTADQSFHQPAVPVTVIDTVAAGDAFNGALAVALSMEQSWPAAVAFATAAAAHCVTQSGAQAAMATRAQVEALRSQVPPLRFL